MLTHHQQRNVDQSADSIAASFRAAMCSAQKACSDLLKAVAHHPDLAARRELTAAAYEILRATEQQIRIAQEAFEKIEHQAKETGAVAAATQAFQESIQPVVVEAQRKEQAQ